VIAGVVAQPDREHAAVVDAGPLGVELVEAVVEEARGQRVELVFDAQAERVG